MKRLVQILAIVGTGVVIGSVAGKYLKTERKQLAKYLKDLVKEDRYIPGYVGEENQDELELYFV